MSAATQHVEDGQHDVADDAQHDLRDVPHVQDDERREPRHDPQRVQDDEHDAQHDVPPPQLPAPQIDLSLSMDAILDGLNNDNLAAIADSERKKRLDDENSKLDQKLKEMQDRLAAAERKSKEIEAKRRSQQQN